MRRQGCGDVFDERVSPFEPDRHPDEPLGNAVSFQVVEIVPAVRRNDEALHAAPAHADSKARQPIDEIPRLREFRVSQNEAEQT